MSCEDAIEPQGKLLRAWQLAVLRFAVTLDDDDRMHAHALAGEVDRFGGPTDGSFRFFRRTTAELCRAICGHHEQAEAVLWRFLAQIDNPRLRRAFEAAIAKDRTPPRLVANRTRPNEDLWKGLASRRAAGR
ncbi:hypothetical protein [Bradyrhizobium macuxiense]|uniref:hypothetical protein n=1 Tax=Bradyrhizobium macuxiense TaxID=1755647 RepID=UPI000831322B|nr:hypothetical protein [Bradyrhizobium macuxiense]